MNKLVFMKCPLQLLINERLQIILFPPKLVFRCNRKITVFKIKNMVLKFLNIV